MVSFLLFCYTWFTENVFLLPSFHSITMALTYNKGVFTPVLKHFLGCSDNFEFETYLKHLQLKIFLHWWTSPFMQCRIAGKLHLTQIFSSDIPHGSTNEHLHLHLPVLWIRLPEAKVLHMSIQPHKFSSSARMSSWSLIRLSFLKIYFSIPEIDKSVR